MNMVWYRWVKQITARQQKMLIDGRAEIFFKGTLIDEGADQQPISVYVSDKDDVKSSDKCPLIFRIKFMTGAASATRVEFLYMTCGKETVVDAKELATNFRRGDNFEILLHVQPNTVRLEVNGITQHILPARRIGYDNANFLFVTGNGMENSSIDILTDDHVDSPCTWQGWGKK
ncbi:uncharacterized protein [Littorina saxatilis]|uniref:uncharacterized protein n=1 Tax=Littorina saxatilis TaxID=31220 RepID=UPI0038B6160C